MITDLNYYYNDSCFYFLFFIFLFFYFFHFSFFIFSFFENVPDIIKSPLSSLLICPTQATGQLQTNDTDKRQAVLELLIFDTKKLWNNKKKRLCKNFNYILIWELNYIFFHYFLIINIKKNNNNSNDSNNNDSNNINNDDDNNNNDNNNNLVNINKFKKIPI